MNRQELRQRFLAAGECWGIVNLSSGNFDDADFAAIVRDLPPLPQVEVLTLHFTQVGDEGLIALAQAVGAQRLPQLQELELDYTQVGDEGLIALARAAEEQGLLQLRVLGLEYTQVGDDGLVALARAALAGGLPQLQSLGLYGTQVGDDGLIELARAADQQHLSELQILTLGETEVGNKTLKVLARAANAQGLGKLYCLILNRTQVGDEGLIALARAAKEQCLPQLHDLWLDGTQVKSVLPEILATRYARDIFEAILEGVPLHLLRIAFVGMGHVGKTCLFRRLFLNEIVDVNKLPRQTHDIDLTRPEQVKWKPIVNYGSMDSGIEIDPHVWDLGGQLVLHGVHESFLKPDRRTIYILVLAANRPPQRATDARHNEIGNGLDYWLRTIAGFVGREAPVIVAVTQCDWYEDTSDPRKVDEPFGGDSGRAVVDCEADELTSRCGAAVTKIVDGCSAVSAKYSIHPLRQAIEETAATLSAIREEKVSRHFIDLMQRVEEEMSNRSLATIEGDYRRWCHDCNITGQATQDTYLRVLDHLGTLIYFGRTPTEQAEHEREKQRADHPRRWTERYPIGQRQMVQRDVPSLLQKYAINPAWFTRPLYGIIRESESKETRDRNGWIDRRRIKNVVRDIEKELTPLLGNAFPQHEDGESVVFEALDWTELCHRDKATGEYFFPRGALDEKAARYLPDWAKETAMADALTDWCFMRWDLLRESAVHRLIVRWYPNIVHDKCWRYGMVVAKDDCQAAVIANPDEGTLRICLHGGDPNHRAIMYGELRRDLVEEYVGQSPVAEKRPQEWKGPPTISNRRSKPPKRGPRLDHIEKLEKELKKHLRTAKHRLKDTGELLPRPSKEFLAKLVDVNPSTVTRCFQDPLKGQLLQRLYDCALNVDCVRQFRG
jgi:GTPase SAR1 family protein